MEIPVNRIFDLLPRYAQKFDPKDDVLAGKEKGVWKKYNINQFIEIANNVSYGLLALGIKPGDKIATITNNRPEWNFLDMGIIQTGAIHLPVYPTISEADYQYILNHSMVKYVFVSSEDLYRKISNILPQLTSTPKIYITNPINGYPTLDELIKLGSDNPQPVLLEQIKSAIQTDDCFTIIYTSGTTGNPKGVMLSHRNLIYNIVQLSYIPQFGQEGKALSFLPLCHVYERMLNYLYLYLGISIYYAESLATIADNIKEIRPQMMCCVPRLLEKVYDKFISSGQKLKGIKRAIFFWAVHIGKHYELKGANGWWYELKLKIAYKLVLSKWHDALGGNFQIIVSGGAAILPRLSRIYWASKLPIYEGYGLTETSPVIAVTSIDSNGIKFGTVGPPLRGVDVKIADDGEIICKSPSVMLGYYKDDELTKSVIDKDGWFHTGDIGEFEPEGQLKITGRKKEIFKTSLGKYIAPELIENKIKASPFIDNIMVVGENQKFAAALIIPDFVYLKSWCQIKEVEYTTDHEMVQLPRIKKRFQKEIEKYNKQLGKTEQIKKLVLMDAEWSLATGELSPTLKLRRNFINKKYQEVIKKIFDIEEEEE